MRCLTGEAYYDSILNPKSIKLDEDVEPREGAEGDGCSDTEAVDDRAHRRMRVKPAPEEEYQSRSRKTPTEKLSGKRGGITSLMDEYDKLLN